MSSPTASTSGSQGAPAAGTPVLHATPELVDAWVERYPFSDEADVSKTLRAIRAAAAPGGDAPFDPFWLVIWRENGKTLWDDFAAVIFALRLQTQATLHAAGISAAKLILVSIGNSSATSAVEFTDATDAWRWEGQGVPPKGSYSLRPKELRELAPFASGIVAIGSDALSSNPVQLASLLSGRTLQPEDGDLCTPYTPSENQPAFSPKATLVVSVQGPLAPPLVIPRAGAVLRKIWPHVARAAEAEYLAMASDDKVIRARTQLRSRPRSDGEQPKKALREAEQRREMAAKQAAAAQTKLNDALDDLVESVATQTAAIAFIRDVLVQEDYRLAISLAEQDVAGSGGRW